MSQTNRTFDPEENMFGNTHKNEDSLDLVVCGR